MRFIKSCFIMAFLGLLPVSAHALILNYTGNNFDTISNAGPITPTDIFTTSDSVSFSLTLSSFLGANLVGQYITPVSFTSYDGVNEISNLTATDSVFQFWTSSSGEITNWFVNASIFAPTIGGGTNVFTQTANWRLSTISSLINDGGGDNLCGPTSTTFGCAGFGDPFYAQISAISGSPGVWSYQTPTTGVPEPGVLSLFAIGLLGLAYRKKQTA